MRLPGIVLLILGFFWIAWDAADGFCSYQHTRWIWQTKHLPAGDTIPRTDAIDAMREMGLALKDRHRMVLLPVSMMLAGGLLAAFGKRNQKNGNFMA
jgi:hypothetical protein